MCIVLLCYSLVPLGRHGSDRQDMAVLLIDPLHITETMWCVFSLDQYAKQKRPLLYQLALDVSRESAHSFMEACCSTGRLNYALYVK